MEITWTIRRSRATRSCACLAGLLLAGCAGGGDTDPCQPNPCAGLHQTRCLAVSGEARCLCEDGYVEADGDCVLRGPCSPNPCELPNRGVCQEQEGQALCLCDAGHVFDATGACVPDPCLPNPCQQLHRTRCEAVLGMASCRCDQGYVEDGGGQCVPPDPCQPNPCQVLHRTRCVVVGQGAECRCDAGYVEDGGGCVRPCELTPCQTPPRTLCANRGESAVCLCSAGTLEDEEGSCRDDPCDPAPCGETRRTACVRQGDAHLCACDPGYRDQGGECVRAASQLCSAGGFCLENPLPTADDLTSLWLHDEENVLVAGQAGRLLHWNGEDAVTLATGTWLDILAVHGLELGDIWAVGQDGLILHYDGQAWQVVLPDLDPPVNIVLRAVWAADTQHVHVSGDDGTWLFWDGLRWARLETGLSQGSLHELWGTGPFDVYATADFGRLLHWDGEQVQTRIVAEDENVYGLWAGGPEDLVLSTSSGKLWRFDGVGFELIAAQGGLGGVLLSSVWSESPGVFWTAGFDIFGGRGVVQRWDGQAWENVYFCSAGFANDVEGFAGGPTLAAGAGGLLLRATAGETPELLTEGRHSDVFGLAIAPDGTPWACGNSRLLLSRGPEGWTPFSFPADMPGFTLWDLAWGADGLAYLACSGGRLYRWDGEDFELLTDGDGDGEVDAGLVGRDLRAVWPLATGEVLVAGQDGLVGIWDGDAWVTRDLPGSPDDFLLDVWGTGLDDVWVVGENLGVFHHDGNGWQPVTLPRSSLMMDNEAYRSVQGTSADELTITGNLGALVHGVRGGTGELVWTLEPSMTNAVLARVSYLPDGSRVVLGDGGTVLWAAAGQGFVSLETGTRVNLRAFALAPDGAWLLGGHDGALFRKAP